MDSYSLKKIKKVNNSGKESRLFSVTLPFLFLRGFAP